MTEEERYIFSEDDFDIRVSAFDAIGHGNEFGWRLWNIYTDRSAGMGGPYKTKEEAYKAGYQAALKEAERLNAMK